MERKYNDLLQALMTDPEFPIMTTAVPVWSKAVVLAALMLYGILFGGGVKGVWILEEGDGDGAEQRERVEAGKCMLPCRMYRTAQHCM